MVGVITRIAGLALLLLLASRNALGQSMIVGRVLDPLGKALPGASIQVRQNGKDVARVVSGPDGRFAARLIARQSFQLRVEVPGFYPAVRTVNLSDDWDAMLEVRMDRVASRIVNVTVTADINQGDVMAPDPSQNVFVRQDLIDANPGRPGAPVSIPGYPAETASGGIKAPQYFAPGVAGDHGEPIAQYVAVGSYLLPNNLSANAHGNGYADPNILIPEVIESVQVDGGAFNVREGNHSVNQSATYGLRPMLNPFATITGDYRDLTLTIGISPSPNSWIAFSGSFGNGFLDRLEHRQQYKFNGERCLRLGTDRLTLFGIGYYGTSYIPGLVPISRQNTGEAAFPAFSDTIDPRQKEQTHTALVAANDVRQLGENQQLQFSGFFRTYNLSLFSDFGQGLIRQSEFRTVTGGSASYVNKSLQWISFLAGLDFEREAPRRDDLDRYGFFNQAASHYYGPFVPVDAGNITISSATPYVAAEGLLLRRLRYYLGWRRDEISIENDDLLHSQNSFQKWIGVNAPKATVSLLPKAVWYAPLISLSFGQSFFTEDPRIGMGSAAGSPVAMSHSYQVIASKTLRNTDLKLTLGHVTNSAQLAKIDPDTGLQFDQGPGRLRFLTITARQTFRRGSILATFSKADARELLSGLPTPEAPRTLFDLLGTLQKLPFQLQARGEFEYVGAKPLGTGCLPNVNRECVGTSVKEFRGAVIRTFQHDRFSVGVNFLLADGFAGQTTENVYPSNFQEAVGVRVPSYVSATFSHRFGGTAP